MGAGAAAQRAGEAEAAKRACLANLPPGYPGATLLSADVGGTSSRLHLFLPPEPGIFDLPSILPPSRRIYEAKYSNAKFDSFTDVLKTFLKDSGLERPPVQACLAVAGVVVDNKCSFVNRGWIIDGKQIQTQLRIGQVTLINDFVAQGYGITSLDPDTECDVLQKVPAKAGAPVAVLGAGTGLGEAFATVGANGDYEVWPTEGGHKEFAPRHDGGSSLEFEMIQYLQIKYSAKARISVERVVSGRGLGNIYEFLAWKFPAKVNKTVHRAFIGPMEGPRTFDPAAITEAAHKGECELCSMAVELWCGAYGAEAGVMALKLMPYGGLYITGGVTNKLRDFILGKKTPVNHFMEAFMDKGRVTPMLMRIPVYLVRGEDMGERGAQLRAQRLYLESLRQRKNIYGDASERHDHDGTEAVTFE